MNKGGANPMGLWTDGASGNGAAWVNECTAKGEQLNSRDSCMTDEYIGYPSFPLGGGPSYP